MSETRCHIVRIIKRILALLTPAERRRGFIVLGMMMILAVLETAGVASIMPFLAVLGNPALVETNSVLSWIFDRGGFESVESFLFLLGVAAFLLMVFSAFLRIGTTYAMNRFTHMRRYSLGTRLLQVYLRQPYEFFLNRNSANLSKSVLSEVDEVVNKVLKPGMELIAFGMITLVLVAFLVVLDPLLAMMVALIIGGAYGVIYLGVRGLLRRMGGDRVQANRERFTAASEAFGGIKDLKILGREQGYVTRFRGPARRYAQYASISNTLNAAPRYLIETIAFGGILVLALVLLRTRRDLGEVLPMLGLYAFAGYRLLPSAQRVYVAFGSLRYGLPAVDEIYDDLTEKPKTARKHAPVRDPLSLTEGIRFDQVSFRYPAAELYVLRDLNVTIAARTVVAFVGETGAGKTTAVDILLGLLEPTEGRILIDGQPLTPENVRRWQSAIGYVPQEIYLADSPVLENIAFGLHPREIDREAVERAAKVANIHDFIIEDLPHGYDTEVGERGVRLSGGQRQRIGIARALYHDPPFLVMDEGTSAVDTATERAIMESVERLSREKTIVMIAHRLSTVERCDQIIVLERGQIRGIGNFQELKASNVTFRKLAVA